MVSFNGPCVMISSTYYDLRQVRADLEQFLTRDLGYQALLSEFPSFPVDPDKTTIENCRARVEQNADILVLVIGGRYGSVDAPSDKSVTNLEYLAARAKGIPIYAFVEKRTLGALTLWEANPDSGCGFEKTGYLQGSGAWNRELAPIQKTVIRNNGESPGRLRSPWLVFERDEGSGWWITGMEPGSAAGSPARRGGRPIRFFLRGCGRCGSLSNRPRIRAFPLRPIPSGG